MRSWPIAIKLLLVLALALVLLPLVLVSFLANANTFFSDRGRDDMRRYWCKTRDWVLYRNNISIDSPQR